MTLDDLKHMLAWPALRRATLTENDLRKAFPAKGGMTSYKLAEELAARHGFSIEYRPAENRVCFKRIMQEKSFQIEGWPEPGQSD